ncbi:hypothetical protein ACFX2A_027824 [Malus domestica]
MKIVETARAIFLEHTQGDDDFTSNPNNFVFEEGEDVVIENGAKTDDHNKVTTMVDIPGQMTDIDVDDNHEDQLHNNYEESENVEVQNEIEVHADVTNNAQPIMQHAHILM